MSNYPPGVSVSDLPGHSHAEMWVADRSEELFDDGMEWIDATDQAWQEWKELEAGR